MCCYSWMLALEAIRTVMEAGSLLVAILQLIAEHERVPPPPGNQFLYPHRRVICTFCGVIQSSQRMIRMLLSEHAGGAGPTWVTQGGDSGGGSRAHQTDF
ncbi:unnamed protein product [Sphagnum jensenii]|uniref:Secreted protein n=1 Tax=Sphagnum jensenii TaxID=128206 RepID=A0ABP0WQ80_9BRYO